MNALNNCNKINVFFFFFFDSNGLEKKGELDPTSPIGIFNGKVFSFRLGTSKIMNLFKTLWHYGVLVSFEWTSPFKSTLKNFKTIYTLQERGESFASVPDMLKAMGNDDMYALSQVTAKDYFVNKLGWSEKLVEEFMMAAMRVNYGQSVETISTFTAYVSLDGVDDGSLWSVVSGNWNIPSKVLEASGATFHEDEVTAVTRIKINGKVHYKLTTIAGGDFPGNFDVRSHYS